MKNLFLTILCISTLFANNSLANSSERSDCEVISPSTIIQEICEDDIVGPTIKFKINLRRPKKDCKRGFGFCGIEIELGWNFSSVDPGNSPNDGVVKEGEENVALGWVDHNGNFVVKFFDTTFSVYDVNSRFEREGGFLFEDDVVIHPEIVKRLSLEKSVINAGEYPITKKEDGYVVVF